MLEKLLTSLWETYSNNLLNIRELANKTKEFELIMRHEADNGDPSNQVKAQDNQLEELLTDFVNDRTELFRNLKSGTDRALEIQDEICRLTDTHSFELNALKPSLSEQQFQEFSKLTNALLEELKIVLELDKVILPWIEKEIQGVKGELYRLQGAKMTKNAYQNQSNRAPRFIDKNK